MKTFVLKAKIRRLEKTDQGLTRDAGWIPAELYGHEVKNVHLAVETSDFEEVYEKAGGSSLVDLKIDGKTPRKVLIHEVQYHPVKDTVQHVDFYQVRMDEEIEAEVEIEFTGLAPAVKELGGVLVKNFDKIKVKCLPADLPPKITVDVSCLKTFDDAIKITALGISDKVKVLQDKEVVIVTVTPPRSEEELKQLEEEVTEDVEQVEGVKEEPKEGETEEEAKAGEAEEKKGTGGAAPTPAAEGKPADKAEKK